MKTLIVELILTLVYCGAIADSLQSKLMDIASQEAAIANIGANKSMMLFGVSNPLEKIERWNQVEQKAKLSSCQIDQINALELQKQNILNQVQR